MAPSQSQSRPPMILRVTDPELASVISRRIDEFSTYDPSVASNSGSGGRANRGGSGGGQSSKTSGSGKATFAGLPKMCAFANSPGGISWTFVLDGARLPARLKNLPCPVELHKSHDLSTYTKCTDVGQMLVVYRDRGALEEAEKLNPPVPGFPSYHHSGLTPPMRGVVRRRFAARSHKSVPPDRRHVEEVENLILALIAQTTRDAGKGRKGPGSKQTSAAVTTANAQSKVLEDIVEDIVDYEPYMDDYGNAPFGIEIREKDALGRPEMWLTPPNSDDEDEEKKQDEADSAKQKSKEKKRKGEKNKSSSSDGLKIKVPHGGKPKKDYEWSSVPEDKKSKKKDKKRDATSSSQSVASTASTSRGGQSPSSASGNYRPSPASGTATSDTAEIDTLLTSEDDDDSIFGNSIPGASAVATDPDVAGLADPSPRGTSIPPGSRKSPVNMDIDISDELPGEEDIADVADVDVGMELNAIGDGVEDTEAFFDLGFDFEEDMQL
mmetsp:Transcript_13316/g.29365  ORF Transcript_13316/g.29365 Transcript_13316/m.29365 type:complete len:495 (-) Transcript_13316:444-1928(-)|eukprot:CAMPEP_0113308948 /NCGR_PEP_ID=MMETSP0010_2-20120614/7193_1 /TAXON_ID=216773 ORGANISM="Corethron hystrix, Strain 308" /NCGR_SAMPLE_ID=MMETSP0010_2 /ASSEMBLY_ACC=CAM_ASM_000155 /LENGTH=494 /DNA_ID=CAMNT_0000164113 /DNA_START=78 /DNA_END=1562 /DNA_ORIENTATION=+ /assembly_acc=CAM_ASM_000155